MRRSKRKTKYTKDLRVVDEQSQAYWDEVLRRHGLGMEAGHDSRKLVYTEDIDKLADFVQTRSGRNMPKPQSE
jgi:hypothetical protein